VKRTHWLSIGLFICALVAIFITGSQSTAQEGEPTPTPAFSYINVEAARVRAAPDETALSIGTLLRDARVIPYNRDESGAWVLVEYAQSFGWIRRDLAVWVENIDALPILTTDNLTPTPAPRTPSPTPRLVTLTPVGSYIIARVNVYVRTGPGLSFTPLGVLTPGSVVEPLNIDETGTWVLIRYTYDQREEGSTEIRTIDGFGWVTRNVVLWVIDINELPILYDDALTPTATFTPSFTPSATPSETTSPTFTPSPTVTNTPTATITPSLTNTDIPTETPSPTATNTEFPSETPSATVTNTDMPSETPSATVTNTDAPTETPAEITQVVVVNTDMPSETATNTEFPSETPPPTATNTDTPSETLSATATNTDAPTETPAEITQAVVVNTDMPSETATNTEFPSETPPPTATNTDTPSETPSATVTNTDTPIETATPTLSGDATAIDSPLGMNTETPTLTNTDEPTITLLPEETELPLGVGTEIIGLLPATETPTVAVAIAQNATETPLTSVSIDEPLTTTSALPIEAIFAGSVLGIIILYVVLYLRGQLAVERYANGFVVDNCPVCRKGHLEVETRIVRWMGIPRPRRTVRCDNCRSLLRETGAHRWRYAVDKLANLAMYDRYNGLEVDERTLQKLSENPIRPSGED